LFSKPPEKVLLGVSPSIPLEPVISTVFD